MTGDADCTGAERAAGVVHCKHTAQLGLEVFGDLERGHQREVIEREGKRERDLRESDREGIRERKLRDGQRESIRERYLRDSEREGIRERYLRDRERSYQREVLDR